MNELNKRIYKRILSQWQKYLSLLLMLVIMISAASGFFVVSDSIKKLDRELMTKGKVEDGQITTIFKLPEEIIDDIEEFGVKTEETYNLNVKLNKNKTLRVFKNRKNINLPLLNKGRLAENENEIAINNRYAMSNDLKIGDNITIPGKYFNHNKDTKFKIVGMFAVPDYETCYYNNTDLIFDSINFGIALLNEDGFSKIDESQLKLQLSYRFNNQDLSQTKINDLNDDIIEKANQNGTLMEYIDKKDNNAINMLINDMDGDRPMMLILMSILILLISFLFGVSIVKTIHEESEIIGILLANGYSKLQIIGNYLASPILITIIASIIGNILGYTAYIPVYKNMYYLSFDLPNYVSRFNLEALILTTIIPFVIILVSNFLYVASKLKFTPLDFLKRNLHKNKKQAKLSLHPKRFLSQLRMRIILANIGDFVIIIIGTFITSILLLYGLSAKPTFDGYDKTLKETMVSNYQYILKYPVELKNESMQAEKYTFIPATSYHELRRADETVQLIGLGDNSKYYPDLKLPNNKNEIVISSNYAKKFKVKVGDTITIKSHLIDEEISYKIVDIYEYNTYFVAFSKQEYVNDLIDQNKDYFNGYYSNEKLDIKKKHIATVIDESTVSKIAEQLNTIMGPTIGVFIGVSLIFFIIFIYNLSKMITEKNQTSIAYLKILGYESKEINKIYIRAITITMILTVTLTVPLQLYVINTITYYALLKFSGYIEFIIPNYLLVISIFLSLSTYAIVAMIQSNKINMLNYSEVLKNRE